MLRYSLTENTLSYYLTWEHAQPIWWLLGRLYRNKEWFVLTLCVWLFQIEKEPCPHCAVLLQRWLPKVSFFKIDLYLTSCLCNLILKLLVHGGRVIQAPTDMLRNRAWGHIIFFSSGWRLCLLATTFPRQCISASAIQRSVVTKAYRLCAWIPTSCMVTQDYGSMYIVNGLLTITVVAWDKVFVTITRNFMHVHGCWDLERMCLAASYSVNSY